jgi:hypothetical protein
LKSCKDNAESFLFPTPNVWLLLSTYLSISTMNEPMFMIFIWSQPTPYFIVLSIIFSPMSFFSCSNILLGYHIIFNYQIYLSSSRLGSFLSLVLNSLHSFEEYIRYFIECTSIWVWLKFFFWIVGGYRVGEKGQRSEIFSKQHI